MEEVTEKGNSLSCGADSYSLLKVYDTLSLTGGLRVHPTGEILSKPKILIHVTTLNVFTYICIMEIGKEIKQIKFKNEYQKLIINLGFTSSWVGRVTSCKLKDFKLTPQQFNILRILRGQHPNPATINLLTERMIDKSSNASRLVDKLITKELVSRRECPADRRQVDVAITKKGLDLLAKVDVEEDGWTESFKSLTATEAKELNRLLDKLRG